MSNNGENRSRSLLVRKKEATIDRSITHLSRLAVSSGSNATYVFTELFDEEDSDDESSDDGVIDMMNEGLSGEGSGEEGNEKSTGDTESSEDQRRTKFLLGLVDADGNPIETHDDDEDIKAHAIEAVKTELERTNTETDTAAITELKKVLPHGQMILDTKLADPEQAIDIAKYMSRHQRLTIIM